MSRSERPDFTISGLTDAEVEQSRQQYGPNHIDIKSNRVFDLLKDLVTDPMPILLAVASTIYFVTGNVSDGAFMMIAIVVIVSIGILQDRRSKKALDALRSLVQPQCRVIRNNQSLYINSSDVVVGDCLLAEEGSVMAADGEILQAHDFSVNESVITGESIPVERNTEPGNNLVLQGTTVSRGLAVCKVTAVGNNTVLGKLGASLVSIQREDTPLQKQIEKFVRGMAIVGLVFFVAVWAINYIKSGLVLASLLHALALAMSILPEEIPVAFATFMALGAWRLSKLGIIVKRTSTVETLGSATVVCADKTGTITQNRMQLSEVYSYMDRKIETVPYSGNSAMEVITIAMWASEPIPFDPMEVALHDEYGKITHSDQRKNFDLVHEYPLSGHPPMMTHIFRDTRNNVIVAAKGSTEGILSVCKMNQSGTSQVMDVVKDLSGRGRRVLGVAIGILDSDVYPESQFRIPFNFVGLVSFTDPPKENMRSVIRDFYDAGVTVKIITGDYAQTAVAIADQIGLRSDGVITGTEMDKMSDQQLSEQVDKVNIFARMFPEAKLRVLNLLKSKGHIVAMTGDGVNDGPALRSAHIGVAMGKRGTELAKDAAAMILSDDDLSRMVDAIAAGRKIYNNLKKAIQYIISIHIPIILIVFVPLILGWVYPFIFTPVHIIFLELIMGPTCSVVYENEPMQKDLMHRKPRAVNSTFFSLRELSMSIIQGLVITAGALGVYQYAYHHGLTEESIRSMVFIDIITANIMLTLVNRSSDKPLWVSIRLKNPLVTYMLVAVISITTLILTIPVVSEFFRLGQIGSTHFAMAVLVGCVSVLWVDLFKVMYHSKQKL